MFFHFRMRRRGCRGTICLSCTRYTLKYLLESAGCEVTELRAAGGYFRLLARRLLNGLQFFAGGARWIWFAPAAMLLVPPALLLPFLDFLDQERNFTLGYICTAKRRYCAGSERQDW